MIYSCKSLWTCLVHCIVKSSSKIWFVKSSSKFWFSIIYLFIKTQATPFLRTLRSNVPSCVIHFLLILLLLACVTRQMLPLMEVKICWKSWFAYRCIGQYSAIMYGYLKDYCWSRKLMLASPVRTFDSLPLCDTTFSHLHALYCSIGKKTVYFTYQLASSSECHCCFHGNGSSLPL